MDIIESATEVKPNEVVSYLKKVYPEVINVLVNILIIIIVLFIGSKLIGIMMTFIAKTFEKMKLEKGIRTFLLSAIKTISYVLLILILSERVGISSTSIFAMLGSAGIAIGLALQGSLSNFAGGVLILFLKPFVVGDYIVSPLAEGSVKEIGLIYTTLITPDNKKVTIPNGSLSNGVITNVTAMNERRLDLKLSIDNSFDIDSAKKIIENNLRSNSMVKKDHAREVFVDELEDNSIIICARVWCSTSNYWNLKAELIEQIKKEFDEKGIQAPTFKVQQVK